MPHPIAYSAWQGAGVAGRHDRHMLLTLACRSFCLRGAVVWPRLQRRPKRSLPLRHRHTFRQRLARRYARGRPNPQAAGRHRKSAAAADSAGPACRIGPDSADQPGHGAVLVERPAVGDCLRPGKRGRSGRSASKRQSPLVAEPQRWHGLLPSRRNGSDRPTAR